MTAPSSSQPMAGLRVIELGVLPAASYTARLLSDFGAEVIRIEPPGGDPCRQASPHLDGAPAGLASGWFAWLNAGKRSIAVDPAAPGSGKRLQRLIGSAQILIDSLTPAERADHGIDHDALRERYPDLIVADVSWFGNEGPYAGFHGTDAVCRALAGLVQLTGPKAGPPLALPDFQAAISAGLAAFVPLAASLLAREQAGGAIWQINVLEASLALAELQASEAVAAGTPHKRQGLNRYASTSPMGIYRCREGWLGITIVTPAQWDAFCSLLGLEDLMEDPRLQIGAGRLEHADLIDARVSVRFLERTAQEWFEQGLALRLPLVPVPDTAALLGNDRFRQRDMLASFQVGGRSVDAPGVPWALARTRARAGGVVPALNEAAGLWHALADDVPHADKTSPGTVPTASVTPLAGIRVIDLSMGWAGPLCTRQMADLGADVIKIESCGYADWWRGVSSNPDDFAQRVYEKQARFAIMNRNKRGITLDLNSQEGVRLVKALVQDADVVVENYSNGVLRKLGLDYEQLKAVKPDLIMVSMSAFGSGGEISECRAYGSTLEQGSGLPSVSGRPHDPPVMNHIAYGDAVGGLNGACAALVALLHLQQTGQGQHIDISQVECMLPYVATWVLAHSANGKAPARVGNRHPDHAPHGVYRCAGEDNWLLVAATSNDMWHKLCKALELPGLAHEPELADAAVRQRQADRIDALIQAWTTQHDAEQAMFLLQRAGVAAGVVRSPYDLLRDPQLVERAFWQTCERPYINTHAQPSAPFRMDGKPLPVRFCAPTLGQHNDEVLGGLLGLSHQEVAALQAAGVIGTEAYPPARFVRQPKGQAL